MTCRGPFQPQPFCDSVIYRQDGEKKGKNEKKRKKKKKETG